jgi:hypothetical protein
LRGWNTCTLLKPDQPQKTFPSCLKIMKPIVEVVEKLTRFNRLVHAVVTPNALLLLGYNPTGSRDFGFKRAQLEQAHAHDIRSLRGRRTGARYRQNRDAGLLVPREPAPQRLGGYQR